MRKVHPWFIVTLVGLFGEIGLGILLGLVNLWLGSTLVLAEAREFISDSTIDTVEALELAAGPIWIVFGVFAITSTVGLMGFFFQVAKMTFQSAEQFADHLVKGKFRFGPGWAIGGWFIPIVAIVVIPLFISDQLDALRARRKRLLKFLAWVYLPLAIFGSRGLINTTLLYEEAFSLADFAFVFFTDSVIALLFALLAAAMMAITSSLMRGIRSWSHQKDLGDTAISSDEIA